MISGPFAVASAFIRSPTRLRFVARGLTVRALWPCFRTGDWRWGISAPAEVMPPAPVPGGSVVGGINDVNQQQ